MGQSHAEATKVNTNAPLSDIAIRLLQFQQRIAAFDRLYNEEISGLTDDLTRLKAEVIRHYQRLAQEQPPASKPTRQRRRSAGSRTRPAAARPVGSEPAQGVPPQKE